MPPTKKKTIVLKDKEAVTLLEDTQRRRNNFDKIRKSYKSARIKLNRQQRQIEAKIKDSQRSGLALRKALKRALSSHKVLEKTLNHYKLEGDQKKAYVELRESLNDMKQRVENFNTQIDNNSIQLAEYRSNAIFTIETFMSHIEASDRAYDLSYGFQERWYDKAKDCLTQPLSPFLTNVPSLSNKK